MSDTRKAAARGGQRETRVCPLDFEVRNVANGTGGENAVFEGFASVTEARYQMRDKDGIYQEIVSRGAFGKSLAGNPNTVFCVNHNQDAIPLARTHARGSATGAGTLQLREVTVGSPTGLHIRAVLDRGRQDVSDLLSAVESNVLDEMSFAFKVPPGRQKWTAADGMSEGFDLRRIMECDLDFGDVSVVSYGANPATAGTVSVRGRGRGGIILPDYTAGARAKVGLLRAQAGPLESPRVSSPATVAARAALLAARLRGR